MGHLVALPSCTPPGGGLDTASCYQCDSIENRQGFRAQSSHLLKATQAADGIIDILDVYLDDQVVRGHCCRPRADGESGSLDMMTFACDTNLKRQERTGSLRHLVGG